VLKQKKERIGPERITIEFDRKKWVQIAVEFNRDNWGVKELQ
jgi:hypothetical protein